MTKDEGMTNDEAQTRKHAGCGFGHSCFVIFGSHSEFVISAP